MFLLGVYADMGKILTEHANTCIIVRNSVCPQIFCTQGKLSEDSIYLFLFIYLLQFNGTYNLLLTYILTLIDNNTKE